MNEKLDFKKILNNPRFVKIALIVGLSAIALIFVSSFVDTSFAFSKAYSEEYCETLENNLLSIVSQIEGVGKAKIFLTMDNNGENVYLNNSDTKTQSYTPQVRGVVVVCDGGSEAVVVNRVMSAVTKSLGIPANKVCVTKLTEYTEDTK